MPAGRPSKYKPEMVEQVRKLCLLGATDAELADFFDVSLATLYTWRSRYPEFLDAQKIGKAECDDRVERSLYQRAIGYSHPDTHISNYQGVITETPIVKHHAPDTTAAIFWLKNRRKEDWRDRQDHEHTHSISTQLADALTRVATYDGNQD